MKKSKTQSFGSPTRFQHDASVFYASKLYHDYNIDENAEVHDYSSLITDNTPRSIDDFPNESLHAILWKVPHCDSVIKEQIQHDISLCVDKLATGGRLLLLSDSLSSKTPNNFAPINFDFVLTAIELLFMRGEIINIVPQPMHQYHRYNRISIFSRGKMHRENPDAAMIPRDIFLKYTRSIWRETDENAGVHCLDLYTFPNDRIFIWNWDITHPHRHFLIRDAK